MTHPYIVPANLYESIPERNFPCCHTATVPWTAALQPATPARRWDADKLRRENAREMYYDVYIARGVHPIKFVGQFNHARSWDKAFWHCSLD